MVTRSEKDLPIPFKASFVMQKLGRTSTLLHSSGNRYQQHRPWSEPNTCHLFLSISTSIPDNLRPGTSASGPPHKGKVDLAPHTNGREEGKNKYVCCSAPKAFDGRFGAPFCWQPLCLCGLHQWNCNTEMSRHPIKMAVKVQPGPDTQSTRNATPLTGYNSVWQRHRLSHLGGGDSGD